MLVTAHWYLPSLGQNWAEALAIIELVDFLHQLHR
jgi:hypothetical protein